MVEVEPRKLVQTRRAHRRLWDYVIMNRWSEHFGEKCKAAISEDREVKCGVEGEVGASHGWCGKRKVSKKLSRLKLLTGDDPSTAKHQVRPCEPTGARRRKADVWVPKAC